MHIVFHNGNLNLPVQEFSRLHMCCHIMHAIFALLKVYGDGHFAVRTIPEITCYVESMWIFVEAVGEHNVRISLAGGSLEVVHANNTILLIGSWCYEQLETLCKSELGHNTGPTRDQCRSESVTNVGPDQGPMRVRMRGTMQVQVRDQCRSELSGE